VIAGLKHREAAQPVSPAAAIQLLKKARNLSHTHRQHLSSAAKLWRANEHLIAIEAFVNLPLAATLYQSA